MNDFLKKNWLYVVAFLVIAGLTVAVAALLINISQRRSEASIQPVRVVEVSDETIDPAVWGQNFPLHYEMFMRTEENYGATAYGGSEPYSKLERNPNLVRLWAGYAFSRDHDEERGHYWALEDQLSSLRTEIVDQPGACLNCHAAETPQLVEELGWEEFNHRPLNEYRDELQFGASCVTCHDPETMELRVTRPAFINAMAGRGIDVTEASHQEMRNYVCAQCHVEYYFAGENKVLTFPWRNGFTIDDIDQYYQDIDFVDWTHAETGGGMLKMQHPEWEVFTTGVHYSSGVTCADCHMPYVSVGGQHVSDHWVRSPLEDVSASCQQCHNIPEEELYARVATIQNRTHELLGTAEAALLDAIDAIVAAREAGATEEELATAYELHRRGQMRWDFISSENSTGFHSPQEAARVLADAINFARLAQIEAIAVMNGDATQASLP